MKRVNSPLRVAGGLRLVLGALVGVWTFASAPAQAQCTALEKAMANPGIGGAAQDQFGISSAMDGDTLVVGAWLNTNSNGAGAGAAYVFQQNAGGTDNWGLVATLTASNGAADDAFGWSVAIHGDRIIVGAYRNDAIKENAGSAYIFERDQGGMDAWGELKVLTAPNAARDDQFGFSVDISERVAVVGAHRADVDGIDDGAVYTFRRDSGGPNNWGSSKIIDAADGADGDLFGRAVAVTGFGTDETMIVGAYLASAGGSNRGAAYIYERDLGGVTNWGERKKLAPSDRGDDDYFGFSVAIEGDEAIVGAYQHDHTGTDSGGAYLFNRNQGGADNWGEVMELIGSDTSMNDWFGYAVAIDADTAVVGAYKDNGLAFESGAVYVFGADYGGIQNYGQSHKLLASDGELGDRFGYSVAVSGTYAAAGAIFADPNGTNSGNGYAFDLAGLPVNYCTAGISASGCSASLTAAGTPSATASSGFTVSAAGFEGDKDGLFFFGATGRQANSWGNGTSFQCIIPPVTRSPLLPGSGTAGLCDNSIARDMNALWCSTCTHPLKNPGAGALVQLQLWYRDPFNTSNQTTSLSDALEFSVCP